MQLPVKAHYATLAMLALAQSYEATKLLAARQIACDHRIPPQFLGQILQQLRAARLIESTRGPNGGFMLSRAPGLISVAEIVDAVCPPAESLAGPRPSSDESPLCMTVYEVWEELRIKQRETLENLSLGGLLQRSVESSPMFYI